MTTGRHESWRECGRQLHNNATCACQETRRQYLQKAGRLARRVLAQLLTKDEYRYAHRSFAVRDALLVTEAARPELGTFGVEHIAQGHNRRSPEIEYLNAGDTYDLTLMYVNGRFVVGTWGDIVERGNYD